MLLARWCHPERLQPRRIYVFEARRKAGFVMLLEVRVRGAAALGRGTREPCERWLAFSQGIPLKRPAAAAPLLQPPRADAFRCVLLIQRHRWRQSRCWR